MKTKSEQFIYEHLEKEYSSNNIHSDSLNELYDDLKENVQRKIKKSISIEKITEIVSKYTNKELDGSLKFKPQKIKKESSIKLNISDNNQIEENIKQKEEIKQDKEDKQSKKITYDMFEDVSSDDENTKVDQVIIKSDGLNKDENNEKDNKIETIKKYVFEDKPFNIVQIKNTKPYTDDFLTNPDQKDDVLDEICIKRRNQLRFLKNIKSPEQKSEEWYRLRRERITASNGGTIIGWNKYNPPYEFILKMVEEQDFEGNENVFHGNKYEDIASLLYQDRMNVKLATFGLLPHPTCPFLGASPDVIVDEYKLDGIHKTNLVGRMIEIKCPSKRAIVTEGEVFDIQCPKHYWVQVQLQLECCDLDECDFIQCNISEYNTWDEYLDDTNPDEPYKSEIFEMEKGCVIQILPKKVKDQINKYTYDQIVYDNAKHIYPPTIYMSPYQYQKWIEQVKKDIETKEEYKDKYFDKVCYWRLENMGCCLVKRDNEWYDKYYEVYEQFWKYVVFFRENKDKFELLKNYINSYKKPKFGWSKAMNDNIMTAVKSLYNDKNSNYNKKIEKNTQDNKNDNQNIKDNEKKKENEKKITVKNSIKEKKKITYDQFELVDSD